MAMVPMILRAPADVMGGATGELFVQATPDEVLLPEGFSPAEADYVRAGPDLMMTAPDGTQVLVADFFMMDPSPALIGDSGARIDGALATRLAGSAAPGQVAGEIPEPSEVIGRVTDLNGEVSVIHADGSRSILQIGDTVFQGDILESGLEAGIGVLLVDNTSLAMGENARLVLDEMVYDPSTQEGSIALSVMQGVFTIVSGEISKTSPDAMTISTPVATIGIRGTQIGLDLTNGRDLTLVMMEEADGFVGEVTIINDGGAMTLNEAYFAITVSSYAAAPVQAPVLSVEEITTTFGSALMYLPTEDTNANDYGQTVTIVDDLAAFDTQAGAEDIIEDGLASFDDVAAADPEAAPAPPLEGLADFDSAELEIESEVGTAEDEFITAANAGLSAGDLEAQTDVIFGEEISPLDTAPIVDAPLSEDVLIEDAIPMAPISETDEEQAAESVVEAEPLNTAPVAEPGTVMVAEDNVFSGQLMASDLEGGAMTFSLAQDGEPTNGNVQINSDGSFSYTPFGDFGGNDSFTYTVTDDAGATTVSSVSVTVTPVLDLPQIAAADVAGYEDNAIALMVAANMSSGTSEGIASVTLSGVPRGALLSAGTDNGDGTWDLEPDQLSDLTLTPPNDFGGSIDLTIIATSSDGGEASSTFGIHVSPVADIPQLAVGDVTGAEDAVIMLTIAAAMPGGTDETLESILLTGVPIDAELSAGTDNGDGTWSLIPSDLNGLSLTPVGDYSGEFQIGVNVISSDGGVASDTFSINVNPVADAPMIATADAKGNEDADITLTLAASMPAGTSEVVDTITVAGVPEGAVLSRGTDNGNGTWTLDSDQLTELTLTPPTDYHGTFNLDVVATSSDGSASTTSLGVTVEPLADVPQLAVADAMGGEDSAIALTLAAAMPSGTSEALYTITIDGVPDGAMLSAGLDNGDGSWTLTPDLMDGLSITPPSDFHGAFDLNVSAVSTDGGTATATLGVNVSQIADVPNLAVSDASGVEDSTITLAIATSMAAGTDETIETILVTGVPEGAFLSAGMDNGDGSWTLGQGDLDDLSLMPPTDYNGVFSLGINVTSSDGGVVANTLDVNVGGVYDIPVIAVGDVSGSEDSAIALTIVAGMPANTLQTLDTITLDGVPDGATLSAGFDNGDGSWTLSLDNLAGLSLNPPMDFSGTFDLNVTAVSSDGGVGTSNFSATVAPVADVPVLTITDVSGYEDTSIALDIVTGMDASTGESIDSIIVENVPDGASLSAGTDNGDGTWTLRADQLDDLSITSAQHDSDQIDLNITVTSSDGGTTQSSMTVNVTPVADAPTLSIALGDGVTSSAGSTMTLENLGSSAGFDNTVGYYILDENGQPTTGHLIWANVKNDVHEIFNLDGVDPDNVGIFLLSDGAGQNEGLFNGQSVRFAQDGDSKWQAYDLDGEQLSFDPRGGLFFAHEDFNTGGIDYVVDSGATGNMNWEDLRGGGDQDFNDVNMNIAWAVDPEVTTFDLYVTTALVDTDGSETLSITVAGVPLDAQLSAGMDNGDGTWLLFADELVDLKLVVPGSVAGDFDLSVSATAMESDGSQASTSETITVDLVDAPDITAEDVSGDEDNAIALNLDVADAQTVIISGMIAGATLSAGTISGAGEWSVSVEDLDGLALIPPTNFSGDIELSVSALSSDGGVSTSTFTTHVSPVADAPNLQVSDTDVVLESSPGEDIKGSKRADELFGTMGDDTIEGKGGDDVIYGDSLTSSASDHDDDDDDDDHGHHHDDDDDHDHDYDDGQSDEAVVVALDVETALSDVDGSEALSIEIAGVPDGANLSVGTDNGGGTWTLLADDLAQLDDLTLTMAQGSALDDFALSVTATSSELETGEAATNTATLDVSFSAGVGGDDIIDGGKGDDTIYAGGGDDDVEGGKGDDELYGQAGDDTLEGGSGKDTLVGGAGDDVLEGGKNADTFVFHAGDGDDIVLDLSHQDVLRFEGQEFNMDDFILQSDDQAETTTITFGGEAGVSVTLNDVEVDPGSGYSVTQDGDAVVVSFDKDSLE